MGDAARARAVGEEVGVPASTDLAAVLEDVDAVSIATPTATHHAVGMACLRAGKHALIEKPLAATLAEGQALVAEAGRRGLALQVGYVQRFNPAFVACRPHIARPRFIESIRIQPFGARGADVDVVLDLMSHDLDLVLSLVRSPLKQLHAVGISLRTQSTDLANVRLMFEDGCVANLTASRISAKAERKMRLFQRGRYFSIDLAAPAARVYTATEAAAGESPLLEERLDVLKGDELLAEITAFLETIATGDRPLVSGEDGVKAMASATAVIVPRRASSRSERALRQSLLSVAYNLMKEC